MSFGNTQRADPHTHFRAPGYTGKDSRFSYTGPHVHGEKRSAYELKAYFGSIDRWEVFRDWILERDRNRPPYTVTLCPRGCALFDPHDVAEFEGRGL